MRLQTKFTLGILPVIALAVFGLGFWSVNATQVALEKSADIFLKSTLKTFVETEIAKRHQILEKHNLSKVSSYLSKFQKEVIQKAHTVQELVSRAYATSHIFALNSRGQAVLCCVPDTDRHHLSGLWAGQMEKVMRSPDYGHFHTRINGEEFHYVATYFQPWDWVIFLIVSDEELGRAGQRIRKATFWIAGAGTLAAAFIIFSFFRRFVVRPVNYLETISLAMERHEPVEKTTVFYRDEVGRLARTMSRAAASLAEYNEERKLWAKELEKKVEDRTRELTRAKESLQTILDAMPFGVTLVDRQKHILSANQSALTLMGYEKKSQVAGKTCQDIFCPADGPCPILDQGQTIDKSKRFMFNKDKEAIPIIKSVVPILLDGQKVLLEAFIDISKQEKAEQKLIFREQLLDFALDQMPVPVLLASAPKQKITRYNKHATALLARPIPEKTHIHLNDQPKFWPAVHPDGTPVDPTDLPLTRAICQGRISRDVELIIRKESGDRWVSASAAPLHDTEGNILAGIVVFPDVTHLKQSEELLKKNAEQFRAIFESTSDCILVWDRHYNYLYANQAAIDHVGTTRENVIGKSIREGLGHIPDFMKLWMGRIDRVFQTQKALRVEDAVPVGNRMTYSESVLSPLKNEAGEVFAVGVVYRDTTERKEIELKLEERNTALERSNQELDDFAYIASHDLKEPLRGIANYSGFLMEDYQDTLDAQGKEKLDTLIKLCKREESLIDALLEYSRVGRTDLKIKDLDIGALVREVLSRITHLTEGVAITIDPSLPHAPCDRVWTGEVFYNLITNAIKYNDKADKRVTVGWVPPSSTKEGMPVHPQKDSPIFFVRDNGIGIREKHQDKIFTIFKRLHGRDKFGGGTGAGLTIVEKIIHCHGGRIWVESELAKGATFYFTMGEKPK